MTTGQKSLREVAEAAREARLEESRESARKNREKSLEDVIAKFHDDYSGFGRLAKEGFHVTAAKTEDFEYVKDVRVFQGGTAKTIEGWKIVIDDVPFVFGTTYQGTSLYLLHNCPKCGAEGASTFFGLDDLGRKLKFGPDFGHKCREAEARTVAYAIGSAARDLNCSPQDVVNDAYTMHGDLINRLRFGR